MKKVWKYIVITLLLLLGLCCVGILYLFFIPNSELFNITYLNNSKKLISKKYEGNNVDTVVLTSRSYDVNILSTEESTVHVETKSRSFGFVLTKNNTFSITESIKDGVLAINIIEPHGFATTNNSEVNLYLPSNKVFNLELSNMKAKTTIKDDVQIGDLSYLTKNGDFDFCKGSISGKLKLTLNKSIFSIHKSVQTSKENDVDLNVTTGKFYASNSILGDISILENKRGVINIHECETLNEDIASAGGSISISKISQITVKTSDTNININEISDTASIKLTGTGSVKIEILKGFSTITTNSGSISLNSVESVLALESDTGNINVWKAEMKISVKTNYGNIQVHFSEKAQDFVNNNLARVLIAKIKNGKLTATGVDNVGSFADENGIKIEDNGRLYLTMRNICGVNDIQGSTGNINIVVNKDSTYILKTKSISGNVRVNLAQIPEYGGYTTKTEKITSVNCETSSNVLTVSTSNGDLNILDTNFA